MVTSRIILSACTDQDILEVHKRRLSSQIHPRQCRVCPSSQRINFFTFTLCHGNVALVFCIMAGFYVNYSIECYFSSLKRFLQIKSIYLFYFLKLFQFNNWVFREQTQFIANTKKTRKQVKENYVCTIWGPSLQIIFFKIGFSSDPSPTFKTTQLWLLVADENFRKKR